MPEKNQCVSHPCGCEWGTSPNSATYMHYCPLHAAAGEMLEALECLVAAQNGPPLIRETKEWEAAMAKAWQAIAHANGREWA